MRLTQTAIVQRAEGLASVLTGGPTRVEKNVLLSVVADFMSDPRADLERLRKTLKLLAEGSGGHLKRSTAYAQQIEAVAGGLRDTLADSSLSIDDLKSLLGWTARLLLVREDTGPANAGAGERPSGGSPGRRSDPPREPVKRGLGTIGSKGLSALEKLKQDLERKERG
jgi:hypothetical protein